MKGIPKKYVIVLAVTAAVCIGSAALFFAIPTKGYVDFLTMVKGRDGITWGDFDRFPHTDVGSGRYVFEYRLAGGANLYLAGSDLDAPPENVYVIERDGSRTDIFAAGISEDEEIEESTGDMAAMVFVNDIL